MPSGRPRKYSSPDELFAVASDYIATAENPTMMGMIRATGLSRDGFNEYSRREEYVDCVKMIKEMVQEAVEGIMLYGKNQVGAIFWLKNWADYKDTMHTDNTHRGRFVLSDAPMDEDEWQRQNS